MTLSDFIFTYRRWAFKKPDTKLSEVTDGELRHLFSRLQPDCRRGGNHQFKHELGAGYRCSVCGVSEFDATTMGHPDSNDMEETVT